MDKILVILNVIVFGILFIQGLNVVFIKKSFSVNTEVNNISLIGIFVLFALPVLLALEVIFKVGI